MSKENDGGPAFPQTKEYWDQNRGGGMSLHAHYAGEAMASLIMHCPMTVLETRELILLIVKVSGEFADAMIAELRRREKAE